MEPLVPCCQLCKAPTTLEHLVYKCSRCQVVLYCSRVHQQNDYASHKALCRRTKDCYELLTHEETKLRALSRDESLHENVFEHGVGMFGSIYSTRSYTRAKYELIRTLSLSHTAMERGLEECMDSLRLCPADDILRSKMPI